MLHTRCWLRVSLVMVGSMLVLSCSSLNTTGARGITYGADHATVLNKLRKGNVIVNASPDIIVAEGQYDPVPTLRARKTFLFRDGKLVSVNHKFL